MARNLPFCTFIILFFTIFFINFEPEEIDVGNDNK